MPQPIQVSLRLRPNSFEQQHHEPALSCTSNQLILKDSHFSRYSFDNIFPANTSQQTLYEQLCMPLIERVFRGEDATVLVMGQKGSGKSYSLIGKDSFSFSEEGKGLIARAFDHISRVVRADKETLYLIKASCMSFGRENITDLLSCKAKQLKLKLNSCRQVEIDNLEIKTVENLQQLEAYLDYATRKRPAYSRKSNVAHFVFSIYIQSKDSTVFKSSKIHFVEHADTLKMFQMSTAGKKLDLSHLALRNVIYELAEGQNKRKVPYDDSKLAWFLQGSFCGFSHTRILITLSPCFKDQSSTREYVEIGKLCRQIENSPSLKPRTSLTGTDLQVHLDKIKSLQEMLASVSSHELKPKQKEEIFNKMDTIYENEFISNNLHVVQRPSVSAAPSKSSKIKQQINLLKKKILNLQISTHQQQVSSKDERLKPEPKSQTMLAHQSQVSPQRSSNQQMQSSHPMQESLSYKYKQLLAENTRLRASFQEQRSLYMEHIKALQSELDFYKKASDRGIGAQLLQIIRKNSELDEFSRTYTIPNFVIKNKQLNLKPFSSSTSLKNINQIKLPKRPPPAIDDYHTDAFSNSIKGAIKPEQRSFFSPYLTRKSHKSGGKNSLQSGQRQSAEKQSVDGDEYLLKRGARAVRKRESSVKSMYRSCSQKFV